MNAEGRLILVVEDSGDDAALIRLAFRRAGFDNRIQTAENIQAGLDYLAGTGQYVDRVKFPFPGLIMLDHKMPGDGWAVIEWVRQRPEMVSVPVVVFSGSTDPNHQRKSMELGASAYHVKPQDFSDFIRVIASIGESWLRSRQ
jgi:CheY-like chemotaxis protein